MNFMRALLLLVRICQYVIVFDGGTNHEVISKVYEIREQQNFECNFCVFFL